MDKTQSQKIVRETFENKFNKARFTRFIIDLLNLKSTAISESSIAFNTNQVPNTFKSFINSFEKITSYNSGESKLDVLVIRLDKEASIERARTMQRNFIAWYLRGGCDSEQKESALAAFVSPDENDWRFSFIKMDYSLVEDKKGVGKIIEQFTPAKRWSFLVGSNEKSHTAQSQLIDILAMDEANITLTQLEEAFSVEKVTKAFFNKYRELFFEVKEALDEIVSKDHKIKSDFEEKHIDTVDFAKKLLGQIVFLYFLQKKGWFGVSRDAEWGTGPKNFTRELFEGKHGKFNNFFNDILEPLFYEALRNDRSYDDNYYSHFDCKIPFLNGGLFDPINDYSWSNTDINLPNDLFSNSNKTKEGDTGTGILDIFDRYNFTVQEDEPLEKVVAVDPEMLGKVFENLLEVKDRKSKGTYYTPREVVHYMCQQSLINYLTTELEDKVRREDIEILIKYGEHIGRDVDSSEELKLDILNEISTDASLIDEKLGDIKICDPAVGSGAFLVGMMSEIIRTRNFLSGYMDKQHRSIYDLKRDCIEKSLYGVDIDPGAVEICKLRLWLSLIVDEEDIRNIKPLPNLDYKIMQGNSLIELLSGEFLAGSTDQKSTELINKLKKSKDELFDITSPFQKEQKRQEVDELIRELFEYNRNLIIDDLKQKIRGIQNQGRLFKDAKLEADDRKRIGEIQDKIEEHQRLQIPGPAEHFEWYINFSEIFQEKSGFDVVIANPPYVEHKKLKALSNRFKKDYSTYSGTADLYVYFYERGINILKNKGTLTYISSNKFIRTSYGEKLRGLLSSLAIQQIVDFTNVRVFDALVASCVLIVFKDRPTKEVTVTNVNDEIIDQISLIDYIEKNYQKISLKNFGSDIWQLEDNKKLKVKEKVERRSKKINEISGINVYRGVTTGYNPAFIISQDIKIELIKADKKNAEIIKPLLQGRNIKKWFYNESNQYLLQTGFDRNVKTDFSHLYSYLSNYEKELKKRDDQGKNWWNLRACKYYSAFEKEKIIWGLTANKWAFAYDDEKHYLPSNGYILTSEGRVSTKYLLALFNSNLLKFYFGFIGIMTAGGAYTLKHETISSLPIREVSEEKEKPFIDLVDKILAILKNEDYLKNSEKQAKVKEYESQIDQMVYELYGLTPEEIGIVENESRK